MDRVGKGPRDRSIMIGVELGYHRVRVERVSEGMLPSLAGRFYKGEFYPWFTAWNPISIDLKATQALIPNDKEAIRGTHPANTRLSRGGCLRP